MEDNQSISNSISALKMVLDSSSESIVLLSQDHKVIVFNKAIKEGVKKFFNKELKLGDDFKNYIIPNKLNSFLETFNKALNGVNSSFIDEMIFDNQSIWFELKMNPVYDTAGNLFGITIYSKNISNQKKAEMELEKMAENFEAIIENTNESIILLDKEFKVLRFNKASKERLKNSIKLDLHIGSDFRDYLYPGKETTFYEQFNNALKGNITEIEVNIKVNDKVLWFRSKMLPVYDRDGNLIGVSIFALNIYDRKIAELALVESEEKFRSIVDAAPTPIIIIDQNMNIVLSNPETENVFGYSTEELLSEKIQLLIPNELLTDIEEYLKTKKTSSKHHKLGNKNFITTHKKNGQEIFVEINMKIIQINKADYLLLIVLDVTKRIKFEQRIFNQLNTLEQIAWQQSHEVRKPLANILGIINSLKSIPDLGEEEKEQYLEILYHSAEDLDSIINKIINYSLNN